MFEKPQGKYFMSLFRNVYFVCTYMHIYHTHILNSLVLCYIVWWCFHNSIKTTIPIMRILPSNFWVVEDKSLSNQCSLLPLPLIAFQIWNKNWFLKAPYISNIGLERIQPKPMWKNPRRGLDHMTSEGAIEALEGEMLLKFLYSFKDYRQEQ